MLRPWPGARVLDVGGGHGQLTGALLEAGHGVTVYGSSEKACGEELSKLVECAAAAFQSGDLLRAPWEGGAFDIVVSYRLLPHVTQWRALVAELCRLARRAVVVDYPTRRSLNALASFFFPLKKQVEGDTRPFTVFGEREIEEAFASQGFTVTARRAEFFLPMALHRALRLAGLSRVLESAARALGLTRALGSPVILRAERREA
jgi:2-polyprenyl-3-methyl-5-hydroxy-6-metoxy-1,4-benzoquinol methylase